MSVFEDIKNIDDYGVEYWMSRDLFKLLEYSEYRHFLPVVEKAKTAANNSGEVVHNHFEDVLEMVQIGSGAERELDNIKLDRYACYLIVQNSDPSKEVVALGQTYFAIQTRRQEISENLIEDQKRAVLREEISKHNTTLASSAKQAGVSNFGVFQNDGYRGYMAV
jgi:DNA-damage-inducible protein D